MCLSSKAGITTRPFDNPCRGRAVSLCPTRQHCCCFCVVVVLFQRGGRVSTAQPRVLGLTARVCSRSIVPHSLCWLPRSPLPLAVSDVRAASVTGHKEVGLRHLCGEKNSLFSWPGVLGKAVYLLKKLQFLEVF